MGTKNRHVCIKEDTLEEIKQLTYRQDEKIDVMYKALMGNGRPGLIEQWQNLQGQLTLLKLLSSSGILVAILSFIKTFI